MGGGADEPYVLFTRTRMKNVDQKSARLVRHEAVSVLLHQLRRLGHLARYLEPREMGMFGLPTNVVRAKEITATLLNAAFSPTTEGLHNSRRIGPYGTDTKEEDRD